MTVFKHPSDAEMSKGRTKAIMEAKMQEVKKESRVIESPVLYGSPSGSAYPGKPDVDMKFKGWVAMFGDHFLCEVGCKRFADKSLDKVLRFIEKEIRHFYEPKQIKKKGKSGVEVKSYMRKSRARKEEMLIPDEKIDKAFDPGTDNEQQDKKRKT